MRTPLLALAAIALVSRRLRRWRRRRRRLAAGARRPGPARAGPERRRGARGPRPRLPRLRDQEHDARVRRRPGGQRRGRRPGRPSLAFRPTRARTRSCSSTRTTGVRASPPPSSRRRRCARPCCSRRATTSRRPPHDALDKLQPKGADQAGGAQVIRIGDVAEPDDLKATDVKAGNPAATAQAIDKLQAAAAKKPSRRRRDRLRRPPRLRHARRGLGGQVGRPRAVDGRATRSRPRRARRSQSHKKPDIYVLGPEAVISEAVVSQLRRLGSVKRVGGPDPVTNAIAFARFTDGSFGWGVTDPGHGLVIASSAPHARRGGRRAAVGVRHVRPAAAAPGGRGAPPGAPGLPARHPARLRQGPGPRGLQSRLADGRRVGDLRGRPVAHRHPPRDPARRHRRRLSTHGRSRAARAPAPAAPGHRRRRAPADGRLDAALRAAAAQPHPAADRRPARRATRRGRWASRRSCGSSSSGTAARPAARASRTASGRCRRSATSSATGARRAVRSAFPPLRGQFRGTIHPRATALRVSARCGHVTRNDLGHPTAAQAVHDGRRPATAPSAPASGASRAGGARQRRAMHDPRPPGPSRPRRPPRRVRRPVVLRIREDLRDQHGRAPPAAPLRHAARARPGRAWRPGGRRGDRAARRDDLTRVGREIRRRRTRVPWMRAGIFLAYWPWFSPEEQVELAVLADELGLDSVWISEAWGQDAVSVLGCSPARRSGSRSAPGCSRSPPARRPPPRWPRPRSTSSPAAASGSASASPGRRSPRAGTACRSSGP